MTTSLAPRFGRPNAVDLGVTFVIGGASLVRVGARPATGQYTFDTDTGVHTFAHADANRIVQCAVAIWTGDVYFAGTFQQVIT